MKHRKDKTEHFRFVFEDIDKILNLLKSITIDPDSYTLFEWVTLNESWHWLGHNEIARSRCLELNAFISQIICSTYKLHIYLRNLQAHVKNFQNYGQP